MFAITFPPQDAMDPRPPRGLPPAPALRPLPLAASHAAGCAATACGAAAQG